MRVLSKFIHIHKQQPLFAVTVLFLGGVGIAYRFPQDVHFGLCAAGFVLSLAWLAKRWRALKMERVRFLDVAILALGVLFLGMGRVAWNTERIHREIGTLNALEKTQTFVCRVTSSPVVTPMDGTRARYAFDVDEVAWGDGGKDSRVRYLPVSASWFATLGDRNAAPRPGEMWQLSGRIRVLTRTNGQDHAYISANKGEKVSRRLTPRGNTWVGRLTDFQTEAARRVAWSIEDWGVVPALNQALLLGCRNEIPEEMRNVFAMSGTIHVFAVSGLHIGIVVGVMMFFVQLTGLRRTRWAWVLIPLIIAYTLVTGGRPSAMRACFAAVFLFAAPLVGRRSNGIAALLATAFAFHFWQPSLVFNAGSVFSFAVMAGLVAFVGPFMTLMRRWLGYFALQKHIELLAAGGTDVRWRKLGGVVVRYTADVCAISVAAWLASVPLTGYYFGRVAIGGLLANPVVTSCAFMVITAGFIGLLGGLASTTLAMAFNNAAGFFTAIMIRTAEVTASIGILWLDTGPWPGWAVALWCAALAACAVWIRGRVRQQGDRLEW